MKNNNQFNWKKKFKRSRRKVVKPYRPYYRNKLSSRAKQNPHKNLGNNRTQMDNLKPEINSRLCDNTLNENVSPPILSSHSTNFDVIPDESSSSIPNCNLRITNVSKSSTDTVDNGAIKIEKSAAFTNNVYNENQTLPIIMSKCNENITVTSKPITTPENSRRNKLRLSISGFCNNSIPSVHERLKGIPSRNGNQAKTRLSTHQRNLSLDFRSMGILLPPVSHVTNTRVNITQHHRNRSLDSALQRIPEVEVSSPNAENEHNFSTNSFLGPTVCSKMAPLLLSSTITAPITSTSSVKSNNCPSDVHRIILKKNDSQSASNLNTAIDPVLTTTSEVTDKKREELTSLGSDDSGIICGSEADQVSLNRVRRSRESLDSGEVDPEEEFTGIPAETAVSVNKECRISDHEFNPNSKKNIKSIKTRKKMHENEKNYLVEDELQKNDQNSITSCISPDNKVSLITNIDDNKPTHCMNVDDDISMPLENAELVPIEENNKCIDSATATAAGISSKSELTESSKFEHIKSEILFKNFFGATKNVFFRTAQSIIDNHEKKNLQKNNKSDELCDVKSTSSDVFKKKEFFVLKPISIKNKMGSTISTKNVFPEISEINQNQLTSTIKLSQTCSDIGNSLQKKVKVPGVVRCFVDDKKQQNILQIEKNSHTTGLLRFFESPVFNIHFAIHYLFYSKEPGVLSFIGNKIFSFPDHNVDLYIPQLIVMYIQMDELAEVLDPYLTYRCKKSVDFSLKCLWLFEAYNYNLDDFSSTSTTNKKMNLSLIKELYSKKERVKCIGIDVLGESSSSLINKKTHHRSQSDATGLLNNSKRFSPSSTTLKLQSKVCSSTTPAKLCLGDLTSGKAFDNGCTCFKSVQGTVNDLLGHKTFCYCGAPKMAPQKEFMKALINVGKNLTTIRTKAEKTSALRLFLNLINKNLPARVWLPLYSDIPHHIVRITEEKTAVLNSKDKTPYIIYVEVVEVDDVFTSPLIMKMMPTLRHTKSEEHLESTDLNLTTKRSLIINSNSESNSNNEKQQIQQQQQQQQNNSDGCTAATEKRSYFTESNFTEDDVWSQEDDEITAQYLNLCRNSERDAISQISLDSYDSKDQGSIALFNIGDVRTRHFNNLICENTKSFSNDPEDPSAAALKEPWHEKEKQIRSSSPYGHLFSWRLLSAIVKCGDDLRQELMATQLLQMFKIIWEEENIDLWVRPYKIVCFSNDSGLIEPILNTVSLHQIKKNSSKSLRDYFIDEYGDDVENLKFKKAQRNFMQSCAAYCLISYLLQVKDRHNGNILLHSDGHLIHIDFGFILSTSPKNLGFEQSPFKLTPEFVDVMGGTSSELWTEFNFLLLKGLMAARKHMDRIINLVEIMRSNSQLPCFKSGCSGTVQNLRKRFHMNLTEQELEKKVEQLVQDSLKSLSTKLYDGYQYLTNGIL